MNTSLYVTDESAPDSGGGSRTRTLSTSVNSISVIVLLGREFYFGRGNRVVTVLRPSLEFLILVGRTYKLSVFKSPSPWSLLILITCTGIFV